MTSEVAVLNRLAVALASDSAASVNIGGRTKLYHADKLFMLSNCRPVGIMINNSSALLNIPWETLIKVFREELGFTSLDRLGDYSTRFVKFIEEAREFFPISLQQDIFIASLRNHFKVVNEEARHELHEQFMRMLEKKGSRNKKHNEERPLTVVLNRELEYWEGLPIHPAMADGIAGAFVTELSAQIYSEINNIFQSQNSHEQKLLTRLSHLIVEREGVLHEMFSNVVIAGFGDKDMFPVLEELEVAGMFSNRLKWKRKDSSVQISGKQPAAIRAFAQSEVAETFLYGANPAYYAYLTGSFTEFLMKQVGGIIEEFPNASKSRREQYKATVMAQLSDSTSELLKIFNQHRVDKFYLPIEQSIAHLPKNELAQVASTLVNLNSFQKRVSMNEDETVGGPVDVAVITRGDGFVWVERKHYFKSELNSHFFNNRRKMDRREPSSGTEIASASSVAIESSTVNLVAGG